MCKARLTIVIDFKDMATQELREAIARLEKMASGNDLETRHVTTEDIVHAWTSGKVAGSVHYSEIHDMA